MTDKTKNTGQSPKNDEIDLIQVFKSIGDFFVRAFMGLMNVILQIIIFSLRKWIYLFLAVVLGLGASYLLSKTQKDLYHSNLVLKSNVIQNQEMISYINRLSDLTSKNNYPILASYLGISEQEAELVNKISAYWFVDRNKDGIVEGPDYYNRYLADTSVNKVTWKFGIRATVTNPALFENLKTGLINYIHSNDYFKRSNEVRIENLQETIRHTDKEVAELDSLQKMEYFRLEDETRLKEGQLVFTNDPEIKLLHADLLSLVRAKQISQDELKIHSEIISILEDFVITQIPANNSVYYARKLLPLFIGLAYFLAVFFTFRKYIVEAVRKKSDPH